MYVIVYYLENGKNISNDCDATVFQIFLKSEHSKVGSHTNGLRILLIFLLTRR